MGGDSSLFCWYGVGQWGGRMKVVINRCWGGFGISEAVSEELGIENHSDYLDNDSFGIESDNWHEYRAHPPLIAAIEKVGEAEASARCGALSIVEIPDGISWEIDDYDGMETVDETHRSWG